MESPASRLTCWIGSALEVGLISKLRPVAGSGAMYALKPSWNANHFPSGETAGRYVCPGRSVSRRAAPPPLGTTHRSKVPPRAEAKTTCSPSGV